MVVPVLELINVSKSFGSVHALRGVNLSIYPGEVIGLMGDNGAGKSTIVKVIAGHYTPTSGTMRFCGKDVYLRNTREARSLGIEVVYQDLALANNLTAAQNVFLGREMTIGVGPFSILNHAAMNGKSTELFATLRSDTIAESSVVKMSGGQRQAVAIARTMLADAKIVLMDEPTAAISVRQVHEVLDLLRRLKDKGVAVILISHRMPDVFEVCDRVIVMRRGEKKADKSVGQSSLEEVTALITGAMESA